MIIVISANKNYPEIPFAEMTIIIMANEANVSNYDFVGYGQRLLMQIQGCGVQGFV